MKMRRLLIAMTTILIMLLFYACSDQEPGNLFKQQPLKKLVTDEKINFEASSGDSRDNSTSVLKATGVLKVSGAAKASETLKASEALKASEVLKALEALKVLETLKASEILKASEALKATEVSKVQSQEEISSDKPKDINSESVVSKSNRDAYTETDNISKEEAMAAGSEQLFYYTEIPQEVKLRINGKSYGEACTIPYEELRYVQVLHWGFDEETHVGELIVNKAIAEDVIDIFKELYEIKYPIERMVLVDEYDADDNKSMADNNSSAFNYRVIDGTSRISLHSYGVAIDINPLYNPYVREVDNKTMITPENGIEYADRSLDCAYYIRKEDACYKAFTSRGFTWGGEWNSSKDYQHFQKRID